MAGGLNRGKHNGGLDPQWDPPPVLGVQRKFPHPKRGKKREVSEGRGKIVGSV